MVRNGGALQPDIELYDVSGNSFDSGSDDTGGSDNTGESRGESGAGLYDPRRDFRRFARRVCSYLGFSLCLLFIIMQGMDLLTYLTAVLLNGYAQGATGIMAGIAAACAGFLLSDGFSAIGLSLMSYAVAVFAMQLFLYRVPEIKAEPKKMRISKLLMFFVLAMGGGYIFNLIGSGINFLLSEFTQRGMEQLNPVTDLMQDIGWPMLIYASLIAPVCEEFVFRKMILNRARPLGEKAAVIFSAVMFGLMHGNIAQFLYATVIGLVLGYMAVKTGRIIYGVIIHIMVNSYSSIVVTGLYSWFSDNMVLLAIVSIFTLMLVLSMIVGAVVIFIVQHRKTKWKRGDAPEGVGYRDFASAMFINPGVITFLLLSFAMILFFALWS